MCKLMVTASSNIIFGVNALLHVFILTTFLVVFYKFYVTKLETDAIHKQLRNMLNKTLPDMFASADSASDQKFKTAVQKMKESGILDKLQQLYAENDPTVTTYNSWLFTSAFITILGLFLLLFVAVFLLTTICGLDIHFGAIVRENIVLFIAIGLAEFLFFTKIALHFVPAAPSYMTQQLTDTLQKEFK